MTLRCVGFASFTRKHIPHMPLLNCPASLRDQNMLPQVGFASPTNGLAFAKAE